MKTLVVRISGGLGNQMFEYALGLSFAKRTGRELRLDLSDFLIFRGRTYQLDQFHGPLATKWWGCVPASLFLAAWIIFKRVSKKLAAGIFKVLKVCVLQTDELFYVDQQFVNDLLTRTDTTLCVAGCYGILPYFEHATDSIRDAFELTKDLTGQNRTYYEQFSGTPISVSIHIRRTDYLMASNGSPALDVEYYKRAIQEIKQRVLEPLWVVFSDDMSWCKETFAFLPNVIYVEGNEEAPWNDIHLIASCRHHIMANSTFSWWGAFLSRDLSGVTIYPETWFRGQPTTSDMVKSEWIPVPSFE